MRYLTWLVFGLMLTATMTAVAQEAPPAVETAPQEVPASPAVEPNPLSPDTETEAPVHTPVPPVSYPWDLPVELDDKIKIRKVYDFLNDPKKTATGESPSLAYEFKYFNHGAITQAQRRSRQGQYFVVTWTNNGEAEDLILRLDYRQAASRDKVHTLEIPYSQARGTFKGTFSVTGDQYFDFGDVHSWRISVVRNGRIVAEERSFVW